MTNQDLKKLRLLVVDDDESIIDYMLMLLSSMGFESIYTCLSAKEALVHVRKNEADVDVIFCDLDMPEMDGVEFLRHLTSTAYCGGIAIISGAEARVISTIEKLARSHNLRYLGYVEKRALNVGNLLTLLKQLPHIPQQSAQLIPSEFREWEIRQAISGGQIHVYYQPKLNIKTNKIVGAEALARWMHPEHGIVGPDQFISAAEGFGLIDELTRVIAKQAIGKLGEWRKQGKDFKMAINLSANSLHKLSLPDQLMEMTEEAGLDPSDLIFEITESQVLEERSAPIEILTRLCLRGMGLSIDDFGTGYASLEQLNRLPFTELKLDKCFVQSAPDDPSARIILESSVQLARKLGMKVVAEGIETQVMQDLVTNLGCHQMQGYLLAKPMPADEFEAWLEDRQDVMMIA